MIKLIIAILSMSVFTDGGTINLFEGIDEIKLNESTFNVAKKWNLGYSNQLIWKAMWNSGGLRER